MVDLYLLGLTVSCGRKADDGSLSKTFVLCSSDPRSWSPSLPACLAGFNQVFKSPRMRSRAKKQAWQYAVGGVDGNGCAGDRLSMVDVNTQSVAEKRGGSEPGYRKLTRRTHVACRMGLATRWISRIARRRVFLSAVSSMFMDLKTLLMSPATCR